MVQKTTYFWFRRDLRIDDNAGLFHALKENSTVQCVFIFDKNILDKLEDKKDARVAFIHNEIEELNVKLNKMGSSMLVFYGKPLKVWTDLASKDDFNGIYTNHDYEQYAIERDASINEIATEHGGFLKSFKDQVIFEKEEILTNEGRAYSVFTPYSRKWKEKLSKNPIQTYDTSLYTQSLVQDTSSKLVTLDEMGFEDVEKEFPSKNVDKNIVSVYDEKRNFPAIKGTTRLSVHLRFGTVSIRSLVQKALKLNGTWLNELIWRDFYMCILSNYPHINEGKSFRLKYDRIPWRNNEEEFDKWCKGETGFPIVDAGMRELNETGFMHNRVRMITASFLIKDLLVDWRWGEAYFAKKLLDFDFSANNGGWQWASGSGCDAAPYFRVFNPDSQAKKFDKDLVYIKKWIPELNKLSYPQPIVDHKMARERAIKTYKDALG